MSTRDISDVFQEVFQTSYNPQNISNITKSFEQHRLNWQARQLDAEYYFVYIDAIHTKIRRSTVANEAIYVLVGLRTDLKRDVLGIYSIPQESAFGWKEVFKDIKSRGLNHFIMCIADGISNLESALHEVYPKTLLQKCVVHKMRNILLKCRSVDKPQIAQDLKHIFDLDNPSHTTNWIERLNKHLRKVEKNKNSFPNEDSALNLLYMAVIEFEDKVYTFQVSSFLSSQDLLNNMLKNSNSFQTQFC